MRVNQLTICTATKMRPNKDDVQPNVHEHQDQGQDDAAWVAAVHPGAEEVIEAKGETIVNTFAELRSALHRLLPAQVVLDDLDISKEVDEAANRLELTSFPETLRNYHQAFGKSKRLQEAVDHVVAINDWYVEGEALVIVEEQQRYIVWGVRVDQLAKANPLVFQHQRDEGDEEWIPYGESAEYFLANNVCWQALNLLEMTTTKYTEELVGRMRKEMRSMSDIGISCPSSEDTLSFVGKQVLCVAFPNQSIVYVGGRDEALSRFEEEWQVSLNWL
jgi:hypothetical protein